MFNWLWQPLWFILPAYMGNTTPIFVKKLKFLDQPVDFGFKIKGKRLFGQNKTWRGLFFGSLAGIFTGLCQARGIRVGFVLGLGALLGDLLGSFIKRRLNMAPGEPHVLLDQTPYVLVPMVIYACFWPFPLTFAQSLFLVLFSLWLHRASNILYFKIGLKEVPY